MHDRHSSLRGVDIARTSFRTLSGLQYLSSHRQDRTYHAGAYLGPRREPRRRKLLPHGRSAALLGGAFEDTVVGAPRFASNSGSCHDVLATNEINWECGEGAQVAGVAAQQSATDW